MKRVLTAALAAALLLFGIAGSVRAWPDWPPDKALISGPGLEGQLEITEPQVLTVLRLGGVEDMSRGPIAPPENLGPFFKIIRYFEGGEFRFADLTYYPSMEGTRSVVYFDDALGGHDGPSPLHKKWLYATTSGDDALKAFLKRHGAMLPTFSQDAANNKLSGRAYFDPMPALRVVSPSQDSPMKSKLTDTLSAVQVNTAPQAVTTANAPTGLAVIAGILGLVGIVRVIVMNSRHK